jgi:hypothetical protein
MFQNLEKTGYEKYLEKYPFTDFLNIKVSDYKKNHRINKISKKYRVRHIISVVKYCDFKKIINLIIVELEKILKTENIQILIIFLMLDSEKFLKLKKS